MSVMMAPPSDRAISVVEVASKASLHPRSVWRLVHTDPEFPKPFKIGGATRWLESAIDAYLAKLASKGSTD